MAIFRCETYVNMTVAVPKESGLYDYGGNLIDKPTLTKEEIDSTKPPSANLSPEPPTLGQVIKATEDLLKIMMTISPGTSPDQSKVDDDTTTGKKKDKRKKKERKNKKGKGLKGKRKNKSKKENIDSPAKDILGENTVKDEKTVPENQPLDILDVESKQDAFNDVLNDEPIKNSDASITPTSITSTYKKEELKDIITSPPPVSRPSTRKPRRKNRQERNGRRERKKKPKTESCGPSNTQCSVFSNP